MSPIRFTHRFRRNLDGILDYIRQENPGKHLYFGGLPWHRAQGFGNRHARTDHHAVSLNRRLPRRGFRRRGSGSRHFAHGSRSPLTLAAPPFFMSLFWKEIREIVTFFCNFLQFFAVFWRVFWAKALIFHKTSRNSKKNVMFCHVLSCFWRSGDRVSYPRLSVSIRVKTSFFLADVFVARMDTDKYG